MSHFSLQYISAPHNTVRKDDLFAIAEHCGVSVSLSLLKPKLKAAIAESSTNKGVFLSVSDVAGSSAMSEPTDAGQSATFQT